MSEPKGLQRLPLVGWLLWRLSRDGRQCARDYYEAERQIVAQISARRGYGLDWVPNDLQRRVVDSIAEAFCNEKNVRFDTVALHPSDPLPLLFWGLGDDLTPLVFCETLYRKTRIKLSPEEVCGFIAGGSHTEAEFSNKFLTSPRTVRELAEFCTEDRVCRIEP